MFQFVAAPENKDQGDPEALKSTRFFNIEKRIDPINLKAILDFCESLSLFLKGLQTHNEFAIAPASEDRESFREACLYVGCYMIINTSMTV